MHEDLHSPSNNIERMWISSVQPYEEHLCSKNEKVLKMKWSLSITYIISALH